MLIYEFRVILPLTVEEYQVAQLYAVAKASKEQTGGGDGVEVLDNSPIDKERSPPTPLLEGYVDGQYTHKKYYVASKLPSFLSMLLPKSLMTFNEHAWNAYPYCRTILGNDFFQQKFTTKIETLHSDNINLENAHKLSPQDLAKRKVVYVDISEPVSASDTKPEEDPVKFISAKTGRGPLPELEWWKKAHNCPVMCAYKLVTAEFKVLGFQGKVEDLIMSQEKRLFTIFHRQLFCWTDEWYGMTMDDIRQLEAETTTELEKQRQTSEVRGLTMKDD